jgi:UDP-N-acetylglucosamine 2-epimerase (non-hydrolysing)
MRILTVFGTRPEVIKLAPVIRAMQARGIEVLVCASGQHRDMLDQMLEVFSIHPDFDLDIMQANQSPLDVASRIYSELSPVIESVRPDWLVVQGDTTTVFAASWVAYHHRVAIAHVEAGLRTQNKFQPFPEEMNRRITSVLADLHFAPTPLAERNLLSEGIEPRRVFVTGNPVVDAVESILKLPAEWSDARLANITGRMILMTAHRRESFGQPLEDICGAVSDLVSLHPDVTVIFPVHRNPAVRDVVMRALGANSRVLLTDPLPYPTFVHVMQRADLILSDSGGVQEEAPSVGTPVLIMRKVTERPEAVESGWAQLIGTSREQIVITASRWLTQGKKQQLAHSPNPFGNGKASERIAELLETQAELQNDLRAELKASAAARAERI